jgi:DNA-binding transcriptional regulator YdaS (Cro superfamily)
MNTNIKKAIELLGSQTELAKACNAKQQHVWNWLNKNAVIPVERAIQIEVATNGEVTKESLNPDFFNTMPKITISRLRLKK